MRTYYTILTCLLLLLGKLAAAQGHNLYFSKYVEGSGYDKALELYNPTDNTIKLGYYRIEVDTDGKGFGSDQRVSKFNLTGTLAPKSSLLIVREVSGNEELKFLADTTIRSNVLNFNGNEQIRLLEIEDDREDRYRVTDQMGFPGATYDMKNMLLVRKRYTAPNNGNPGTSVSSQWTFHSQNDLSLLKLAPGSSNLGAVVDKTKTVGSVGGAASVSMSGAATYNIPIPVLPGVNGLEPQLAIVHNSQGGNGILGESWNLAGLSSIARVPQTIYHDGKASAIKFNKTDRLALDGNRLVSKQYWGEGAEYRTEGASFSKITAHGEGASAYFIVETKDGRILEYGNSPSSKDIHSGIKNTGTRRWLLNKISDKNGNVITYNYGSGSNYLCTYIDNIQYNGNTIKFTYSTNRNLVKRYLLDSQITIRKILTNIDIKRGSTLLYGYRLGYYKNDSNYTDELIKVTKYNGSQDEINPTNIVWKHNNSLGFESAYVKSPVDNKNFADQKYTSLDYNGDGLDDIIGRYEGENGRDIWQVYLNKTKVGEEVSFEPHVSKEIARGSIGSYNFDPDCGIVSADVKGNGEYSAFALKWVGNSDYSHLSFHSFDSNLDNPETNFSLSTSEMPLYTVTDFDSDGKQEFFCVSNVKNNNGRYDAEILELGSTEEFFSRTECQIYPGGTFTITNPTLLYGDYNFNGAPDILFFTDKGIYICEKTNDDYDFDLDYFDELVVDKEAIIKQGDFNGDGVSDIVISRADGNKDMKFLYGNPTGFKEPGAQYISSLDDGRTNKDDDMNNIIVVDFNKDGRDDIITYQADFDRKSDWGGSYYRFNKMVVTHYKATSTGFSKLESINASNSTYSDSKYFVSGDFNGDGNKDILNYGYQYLKTYNSGIEWRLLTNLTNGNDFDSGLVKSITDGFGNKTTYSYCPLTDKSCVNNSFSENTVTAKAWRSKGVVPLRAPLYVVSDLISSNGIGGNILLKYTYDSPLLHNHGRGFLGFLKTTSLNTSSNIEEKKYYKLNDPYIINRIWKTEVYTNKQLVSSVVNLNKLKEFDNKRFYSFVENSTQNDLVNGVETTTTNVYDDYGNLKAQTTNYGSDLTVGVVNAFTSKGSWCNSKVETSIKTTTYKGEFPFSISSSFTYYDNGNLKTTNSKGVTTTYADYDTYGNAKTVTLSANGVENRCTKYEYDDKFHRFVKRITDPIGQTEFFTHNNWGKVLAKTDIAGKVSSNRYDAWGVLTETTYPNNKKSTNSIHWAENNNYNALYYTKTLNEGAPYEKVLYDQKGRVVGTETEGYNGLIYTNTRYNSKGQVVAGLSPHYKGGNAILTSTSYDRHGRVIETNVNNVETTYSYGKLRSTTHSPKGTFTRTTNAGGDVLVSTDPGGTITYKYHSSGQAREITSNGSGVVIEYNAWGQKESLSDPDAGMISYQYTGFGELKNQTDANGNVTSIVYDKAGRVDLKTCGGLVSDYEYYDSGKKIGLLEHVSSSNNTRTDYDYNDFGQLTIEKENIQGKIFQTSYSYDTYNRVNSIAYPSGFTVSQHYNTKGYLTEVKRADNGKSIWRVGSVEANGQVTSFVSGNGKWTHKSLNNDGYLTSIKTDYGRIQNLSYKFDKEKGNLLERKDARVARIETFTYDNLNRLTSSKIGVETQSFQYDKNGNIKFKSMVGDYAYDSPKPHAVTGISNDDGLVKTKQHIDYTAFNKVSQIEQDGYRMNFVYGHDFARRKTELFKDNSKVMTKYFAGNYEQKDMGSKSYKISYIMGGDGLAAMHVLGTNGPDLLYVHKDHLGSVQTLSCDDVSRNYGIIDEFAYDAWGKRIYTDEPGFNEDLSYQDLCRGYTGHEHLHEFGLINMNGRVYDPLLGRFLSPDNYVQLPFFTQNYNRFAYCLNNPLIYTDPSGQTIVGNFFKWVKKNTWDAMWDGLNNFAEWADQNGVPAAGLGYNSAHGTYHYMGDSGNVYHNQFGNNYEGKVDQAVYAARQEAANMSNSSRGLIGDGYGETFLERFKSLPRATWNGDVFIKDPNAIEIGFHNGPAAYITPGGGQIKGLQIGLRNVKVARGIMKAMLNGTYDYKALRGVIAGFQDAKGVFYIGEGHHRVAAAKEILRSTGNAKPLEMLLQNGRWTQVGAAPVGARPLPSLSLWGKIRNKIGF